MDHAPGPDRGSATAIASAQGPALRDSAVVVAGIALLVGAGWAYLVLEAGRMQAGAGGMSGMGTMTMPSALVAPGLHAWSPVDLLLLFTMWAIMMVAMMLPSATPMITLFAGVSRGRRQRGDAWVPTAVFVAGYILLWTSFAALAALAQWGLHRAALLSPMMRSTSPLLGGGLLIAAGIYQFTPLKRACLSQCRSPLGFLSRHWREGVRGALQLGVRHGTYCIGCCAVLMTLLFVLGVMNLLWIAAIAVFVLAEKVLPRGEWIARAAGVLLIGWGGWVVAGAL
ncbi:MAG TPA: DUF2182 domain-containing protein [Longimicrobiales bacterium]|nr:DUF2182 domain-containing protein [Longimicrobiales bacterium]